MQQLNLYLGLTGDGSVIHTSTTTPGNYYGELVVGPIRFLEFLELHLGLSGIYPGKTERVLLLKERLALLNEKDFIFYTSFQNDPLGVSKRLLTLWDTWHMSGWDEQIAKNLPQRMKQLSALSDTFVSIGPGLHDRIQKVRESLGKITLPSIRLHLIDPISSHAYAYQQLITTLRKYAPVVEEAFIPQAAVGSDLNCLQQVLQGKKSKDFTNDGSLQILHFPGDIQAANSIFAIQQADKWNPVIVNTDNSLLNGLHLSKNHPVCSWDISAGNGQVSQLFFLATAMFKRPVVTQQVMAFLSAPISPLSKKLGRELNNIFAAKPGFGNEEWNGAIEAYLLSLKDAKGERAKKDQIGFWLQNKNHLQETTFDVALLHEIFTNLSKWARQSAQLEYYQPYAAQLQNLALLSEQLMHLLKDEGDEIPVAKFERLQAELFSDVPANIADAQVGCADHVPDPSSIWAVSKDILWMNAARYDVGNYMSKFWYQEEKEYFLKHGLPVHDENHENDIYNTGLRRMVLSAKERLVIVVPSSMNGVSVAKPFCLDEWAKDIDLSLITTSCNDLLSKSPWSKKSLTRTFETIYLPSPVEYLHIKGENFSRKCESYTSLENLFQHPAKWYLEYRLGLRFQPGVSLPAESQLRGTIADRVVQLIFKETNRKTAWWKSDSLFAKEVLHTLQQVLETEGLPFLEVQAKRSLHEYKRTLVNSLCALHHFIEANGFGIIDTQVVIEGTFADTAFKGYADLVLTKNQNKFIIDLKWTSSSRSYRERLNAGLDLQLVLYESMHEKAVASAYFLLNDGKMYMRKNKVNQHLQQVQFIDAEDEVTTGNILQRALNSLAYRRKEIAEGKLEVAYHIPLKEVVYESETDEKNLLQLKEKDGVKQAPYDTDLALFFGNIY